ncbi:DUF2339 domain-containing protein [Hoeflea poritis]|uniref:DUF2339 domain-containing protein n=1 Tax=Hoeflea poritis TaxID=2993659 RepID=A0ABT4VQI5_9HYPH|nr:DUF2339 domain-containing protein [Hoeflea poritis]MDA4846977.1 DUF2339 domain-containing protein [Hoeflea poritis]
MFDLMAPILLLAALLVVGPILGTIAFFKVRTLQREVDKLRASLAGSAPDVSAAVSVPSVGSRSEAPERQPEEDDIRADEPAASEEPADDDGDKDAPPEAPAAQPDTGGRGLEETVGAKWAVWVGGLALALGAVFMVRYSIEQGILGPGARILAGLFFSAALIAVGEWTRGRGAAYSVGGFESANVPAILTAAGTLGAFATIYAAYQLYGFLAPGMAFIALGLVAVATMIAALLHGPLLAAIGIVGSYVVPFLVSSQEPNTAGLGLYAFAVSIAAFGVGRLRLWRWLAVIAALGLVFFGALMFILATQGEKPIVGIYILATWAAVFYVFVSSLYQRSISECPVNDRIAVLMLSLVLVLALGFVVTDTDAATVVGLLLLVFIPFASAFFYPAIRLIVPVASLVVVLGYAGWELTADSWAPLAYGPDAPGSINPNILPGYQQKVLSLFGGLGFAIAALAGAIGLFGALRSAARVPLAFGGAFVPPLILAVCYARTDFLDVSVRLGVIALVLSIALYAVAQYADRRLSDTSAGRAGVAANYMIAALSTLTLGLCMVLERGALTVSLALMAPATAYIYSRNPLAALRPLALVPAVLWAARIAWDPAIVGGSLGDTPVFNWLLYGYGIPAIGFVAAAWLLARHGRDRWLDVMEAVAVATVTAAPAIVGLHALDPEAVFTPIDTLPEAALLVLVGGGVALGILQLRLAGVSATLRVATDILGYAGMIVAVLCLIGIYNPLLTGATIGKSWFFNILAFSYLLPGLLYGVLGLRSAAVRPVYAIGAYSVSGVLLFAWISLSIRHWFHPVALDVGPTSDPELYTYSAAWLAIGIATLAAGMIGGVRTLRLLSGVIIVVVVAKVFVVDMSSLTGFLRALSFIGLGAVLVAIGLVYQRLLRRHA